MNRQIVENYIGKSLCNLTKEEIIRVVVPIRDD